MIIAFVGSLIFAFSKTFWAQSVMAEVYTLNAFFIMLTFYILILWKEKHEEHLLYVFSFVYGLSLTNHHTMVLFGPIYAIFIIYADKKIFFKPLVLMKIIIFFILGLFIYLYLPIRALANPDINWGNPSTIQDALFHIFRKQYGVLNTNLRSLSLFFKQVISYISQISIEFSFLFIFSVLGIIELLRKNKVYFIGILLMFFTSIVFILLINFEINLKNIKTMEPFYIPSYLAIAIWIGFGIRFIFRLTMNINNLSLRALAKQSSFVVGIILFLIPLKFNYFENDLSRNYLAYDFNNNILNTLDKDSILFTDGDNIMFPLVYLHNVERKRREVIIYDDIGCVFKNIYGRDFMRLPEQGKKIRRNNVQLEIVKTANKPIYCILGGNLSNVQGIKMAPVGLLNKLGAVENRDYMSLWNNYKMRGMDDKTIYKDYLNRDLIAQYYFFKAEYYFSKGERENALQEYKKAHKIASDIDWVRHNLEVALNTKNLSEEAEKLAFESVEINSKDASAYVNLGLIYFKKELVDKAIEMYKKAIEIDDNSAIAHSNLGVAYEKKGEIDGTISEYKKAILIDPSNYDSHYNLGVVYIRQQRYAEAIDELNKSISINPNLIGGYISLGTVCGRIGKLEDAIKLFNRALEIDPMSIEAYNNLGVAYFKVGDRKKAEENWKKVLSIQPDNVAARKNISIMKDRQ